MVPQSFNDYINSKYGARNSGTAASYIKAIKILDNLFLKKDMFNLDGFPLADIRDPHLIAPIIDYIVDEEDKFRRGEESLFDLGHANQTSYPRKRFCTAAIRQLGDFINAICSQEATGLMLGASCTGCKLSHELQVKYHINDEGSDKEVRAKRRIGQDIFRAMLLNLYGSKCCLTGIDVADVLRASHIIPWAEKKETRLNPENGLCLSATYDAAFDRHLISIDEDYRLILSPYLNEHYSSEAFNAYFRKFEGQRIALPAKFLPSQEYLEKHRAKLVS